MGTIRMTRYPVRIVCNMFSWNDEYNLRVYMRNHLLPIPQPKMETRVRVIGVLYSIYIIICI